MTALPTIPDADAIAVEMTRLAADRPEWPRVLVTVIAAAVVAAPGLAVAAIAGQDQPIRGTVLQLECRAEDDYPIVVDGRTFCLHVDHVNHAYLPTWRLPR